MIDWLTNWDQAIPETSLDHANAGHNEADPGSVEGMEDMPGMASPEQMLHSPTRLGMTSRLCGWT